MKKFIIVFMIFFCIPFAAFGEGETYDADTLVQTTDFSEIERLLEDNNSEIDFKTMLGDVLKGENGFDIKKLFEYLKNAFLGEIREAMLLIIKITALVVLFSFLKELKPDSFSTSVNNAAFFVCYAVIAFIIAQVFLQGVEIAKGIIYTVNSLITMSMPILMSFMVGCGGAKTAACINPVILIGIETVSVLTQTVFIPLIFALGVLAIFLPVVRNIDIESIIKTIKSILKWSMGLVFSLFVGLISLYGSFGSASDALSYRAAKYVVGSAVPVVGPLLSETMGTFTYSCAVVKNAFGIVVVFIIILLMSAPVIKLFLMMLVLNISSMLTGSISDKKIALAINEISGVVSYILALVCLTAVLSIISMAIIIHTANNVVV